MCKPEVVGTDGDVVPDVVNDTVGGDVVLTVTVHRLPYIFSTTIANQYSARLYPIYHSNSKLSTTEIINFVGCQVHTLVNYLAIESFLN